MLNEDAGEAIGIHTNGGCYDGGGSNSGTSVDNTDLMDALANPIGVCAPIGLTVTNLVGGQTATVTAHGASPGETVYFGYGLHGEGEVPVDFLGVIIGISRPNLIGTAVADGSGEASIDQMVRPEGTGHRVWIQAAQMGLTSIVVSEVVQ